MKTQIFSTNNYKLFKKLNGNRLVDQKHVSRIVASMKEQMLPTFIEVNEKYEVIDGQHRIEALRQLNEPVHYFITIGAGLAESQLHNQIKKKWGYEDILQSYIANGNESYLFVQYLMNKYNLSLGNVLVACDKGNHGQHAMYKFVHGTLQVNNKKEIEDLVEKTLRIDSIVKINRKVMWSACLKCVTCNEFDVDTFIQKLHYLKDHFTPQVKVSQQIEQIEEIYNYRNRNKINLRISTKKH